MVWRESKLLSAISAEGATYNRTKDDTWLLAPTSGLSLLSVICPVHPRMDQVVAVADAICWMGKLSQCSVNYTGQKELYWHSTTRELSNSSPFPRSYPFRQRSPVLLGLHVAPFLHLGGSRHVIHNSRHWHLTRLSLVCSFSQQTRFKHTAWKWRAGAPPIWLQGWYPGRRWIWEKSCQDSPEGEPSVSKPVFPAWWGRTPRDLTAVGKEPREDTASGGLWMKELGYV